MAPPVIDWVKAFSIVRSPSLGVIKRSGWSSFNLVWQGDDLATVCAGAEVKDRHADYDSVCDLFEDDGLLGVGQLGVDFYAPIDWAGVHDDGTGLEPFGPFFIQPEGAGIFADRRKVAGGLPFVLNA
jgi:hypothetical protein